jgi:uncharacterized protein YcfJ
MEGIKMKKNISWTAISTGVILLLSILLTGCDNQEAASSADKAITSFGIEAVAGVITQQAITVTVPYGTDITHLSPDIEFTGSAISPASGAPQDFTGPVTYRVTADDGSTRDYVIIVRCAEPAEKAITSFGIGAAAGEITDQAITVTVPYDTDITSLSPDIEFTGNAVSPASGAPQDFTDPVTYRVTAGDGSARDYTVTVRYALSDAKAITSFNIGDAIGVIDGQVITIIVPYGTDLTGLSPVIGFTGSTVSPASRIAQDFTNPVTYQVSADDGSARDYAVTVQQAASDEKSITSFDIGDVAGIISGPAITLTVPYDTDLAALAPVIGFTGNAVSPASGAPQDFTGSVTYRVTASDGSARDYTVIVRCAEPAEKAITSFGIGTAAGVITEQAITITIPYGTDITSLSPDILFTGSAVSPASGTPQDFTGPVTYRVTADDGSTKDYTVIVRYAVSDTKVITAFKIGAAAGIITGQTIAVTVPYGTDIASLSPDILFTGSAVSPASETPQDFTGPVTYRVTAGDGSARDYTVIVQQAASDEKILTSFNIGNAVGVINGQAITITVPYGTDITGLSPVIGFTGAAISPASGAPQDFTNPVTYRVTADDDSAKDYTVTVRYALSDAKAITSFNIGNAVGTIEEQAISVTVPYGTDITSLSPVIGFTGATVNPASGTPQDFANPVTYQVAADDGSTKDYTVTVQFAAGKPLVTVAFTALTSEAVDLTLDPESDLSRTAKDTLQISVTGSPQVRWFINGGEQSATDGTITIAAIDYPVGIHRVTALVYKGMVPYSDEVIFKIVK